MKELRDIKLDLIMGNQNPIIELFQEIISGIQIINCNVYNEDGLEFIYHKDGQWIFYQDCKNEKFWTHYFNYWELFESKFHLKYDEIGAITKYLVVQSTLCIQKVEEALKREVSTPIRIFQYKALKVEDALKREVGTPKSMNLIPLQKVEEALKREVGTPAHKFLRTPNSVEETLKREVDN